MARVTRFMLWTIVLLASVATKGAAAADAQKLQRVPEDYGTIQAAVDAANPGDTILVSDGTWCGATVTKRVVLRGSGQAAITGLGCAGPLAGVPAPASGEVGTVGFLLVKGGGSNPAGTVIENFSFSDVYTAVNATAVDGVVVQHNSMQPQRVGVFSRNGSHWSVDHNRIDNTRALMPFRNSGVNNTGGSGWTVSHNEFTGAFVSVLLSRGSVLPPRPSNNAVTFNHIDGGIDGAGVDFVAQDGIVVMNNDIFVPTDPGGVGSLACGAWGIIGSDARSAAGFLTAINSTILNNNTRETQAGVVIATDKSGGTGNAAGLLLRGNFGTLAMNQSIDTCTSGSITGTVKSRSISTLISCDENGVCE